MNGGDPADVCMGQGYGLDTRAGAPPLGWLGLTGLPPVRLGGRCYRGVQVREQAGGLRKQYRLALGSLGTGLEGPGDGEGWG